MEAGEVEELREGAALVRLFPHVVWGTYWRAVSAPQLKCLIRGFDRRNSDSAEVAEKLLHAKEESEEVE